MEKIPWGLKQLLVTFLLELWSPVRATGTGWREQGAVNSPYRHRGLDITCLALLLDLQR